MIPEEQLKGMITNADRQLLWDIRELLRELVAIQKAPVDNNTTNKISADSIHCKYPGCTEEFENKGKFMAHMKKHKKEGV